MNEHDITTDAIRDLESRRLGSCASASNERSRRIMPTLATDGSAASG